MSAKKPVKKADDGYGLVSMPPRQRLYRLDGINIGTGYVESLSSFFIRLAHKCRVSPWLLFQKELMPILGRKASAAGVDWDKQYFVGAGESTERVCEALETLTGARHLLQLTLQPLASVVSVGDTILLEQMWCPLCLHEMADNGLLYYPLFWKLKGVLACPIHEALLVKSCICNGRDPIPVRRRKHFPGICAKCGRLLYGEAQPVPLLASAGAVSQSSKILGLLTDSALFAGISREELTANLAGFLAQASEDAFEGASSRLAAALGYGKGTLWYWLQGRGMPKVEVLARLATMFDVSVSDILLGRCRKRLSCCQAALEHRQSRRWSGRHTSEDVHAEMLKLRAKSSDPLSISAMARLIGVDPSQLWKAAPELAAEISGEAREYRQKVRQLLAVRLEAIFYAEAHAIADTGRVPTQRLVFVNRKKEIGNPGVPTIRLCAQICASVRDRRYPGRRRSQAHPTDSHIFHQR